MNTTSPLPAGSVVVIVPPEDAGHLAAVLRAGLRYSGHVVTEDDRALIARLDMSAIRAGSAQEVRHAAASSCILCQWCADRGHDCGQHAKLTAQEVARRARVTPKTVRLAAQAGSLRAEKDGKSWTFDPEEVNKWLRLRRR